MARGRFGIFLRCFCFRSAMMWGDSPGTPCVTEQRRGGGEGRNGQVGECYPVTDIIGQNWGIKRTEVKAW